MAEIYEPSEDSYFFAEFLKKFFENRQGAINYLDMGTGSGILSKVARGFINKNKILAADKNLQAVDLVSKKGFNCIKSDLFSNIQGKFDLITFNAPYLPKDSREPKDSQIATTGGEKGDEISIKFLEQALKHLNPEGKIFLLISSLTPKDKITQFSPKEVARKKLFMEELIILEFTKK